MSAHTPGPWTVVAIDWADTGNARFEIKGIRRTGMADARLISAAPELLAALRMVMACAGDISAAPDGLLEMALDDGDEETRRQANAFLVARAAIAKVEGGAA